MAWLRVDDTLHAHRKLIKAGAEAMGLWVACGSFAASAASRQDGSLDADEVATRALLLGVKDWKRVADKLVSAGLWDVDGDLYRFHDWDHYDSAEGVSEAKRLKAAQRQAKSREKKRFAEDVTRDSHTPGCDMSQPVTRDVTHGSHTASHDVTSPPRAPVCDPAHDPARAHPSPAHPIPSQPVAERAPAAPAALPTSDLAEEILAAANTHPRLVSLIDPAFAAELALVATRGGKPHLVAQALDEAAGEIAAQSITDHGKARSLVLRFVRAVRPAAGISGAGGGRGSSSAFGARHGAPEPYNPFGPPTDEELRANGVIS